MDRTKRKTRSHIIDEKANQMFRAVLPMEWTVRDYKPDYGIDLAIELFDTSFASDGTGAFDTLGEHLFVQLKGTERLKIREIIVKGCNNIELFPYEPEDSSAYILDVATFSLETSELLTVQRMGSSVPVLLILVETSSSRVFFLCLNDYIDKVLLPESPDYPKRKTKTIYIPLANEITSKTHAKIPLSFYAKRAKLYAAFLKCHYQRMELEYVNNEELLEQATYFAQILLQFDFWESCKWWKPIMEYHNQLLALLEYGDPRYGHHLARKLSKEEIKEEMDRTNYNVSAQFDDTIQISIEDNFRFGSIRQLWFGLSNLSAMYEEYCRYWFTPTPIGILGSMLPSAKKVKNT